MTDCDTMLAARNGLSHVKSDGDAPLWHRIIPEVFAETVATFGDRDAAVFSEHGERWSWKEFGAKVDALAAGLLALGLEKGDRIGIWSPNRPEWLLIQFASARAGLVLVNINPAYRLTELEYALNKVGCRALLTAEAFKSSDYLGMIRELAPELEQAEPGNLRSARLPELHMVIATGDTQHSGILRFADVMAMGEGADLTALDAVTASLHPDDAINIQFTSGTTGTPKGATLSHVNILNNARFTVERLHFSQADRLCIPVPLYHCFGMVMGTLGCVTTGATMVFPGEGFEPASTLNAITAERCTAVYGVPTMFAAMLDHPAFGDADTSSLRTGIMAGSPCPIELMKRVVADMGVAEVTIAYGMTETSPVSFQSHTDDPIDWRVTTVGRVHPHVEVRIADPETGATMSIGEPGEILTGGYSVMLGYWDDPENTAASIDADGFMHSGDLGTIDAQGYANIVGRVKDMVVRGGENVYPREIEEYLYRHPAVAMVQVFGVPDEKMGEEIAVWIVLREGHTASAEDIIGFCRGQIAHFKVPRYVDFVEEVPMTVTGKAQKFRMREAMVKKLGLTETRTA